MSSQNTNPQTPSPFRAGVSAQHNPSPFRAGVSPSGADKLSTARLLYMAGEITQKGIAKQVGVSERTIHSWIKQENWDRLRQAARTAPAIIAENMFSQLVELQNDIANREAGKRYPTMQEAELTRKLCLSIDRMKSAPALSQSMQVLQLFRTFAQTHYDTQFQLRLNQVIEHFLEGNAKNGFMPYQIEYETEERTELPPNSNEPTETEPSEIRESFPPAKEGPINEKRSLFVNQGGEDSAHETPPSPSERAGERSTAPAKTGSKTEVNPPQNPVKSSIPPSSTPTGNSGNSSDTHTLPNHAKAS